MSRSGSDIGERIRARLSAELPLLPDHLRAWVSAHLTAPRAVSVSVDPEGKQRTTAWLVTDHTGVGDSSSRIVYDPLTDSFGMAIDLADGVSWFQGPTGSLVESVHSM
jgi:hypothetical protein